MKNIKFKVWDKEQKKFLEINWEDEETRYNIGKAVIRYSTENGIYVTLSGYTNNDGWPYEIEAEILQFTGLKDKNGREIYEGDIVEWEECGTKHCPHWIVFEHTEFKLFNGKYHKTILEPSWYEVIGNIYENPELHPNNKV